MAIIFPLLRRSSFQTTIDLSMAKAFHLLFLGKAVGKVSCKVPFALGSSFGMQD